MPATRIRSGRHTTHSPEEIPEKLDDATVGEACTVAAALVRWLRVEREPELGAAAEARTAVDDVSTAPPR